MEDSVSREPQDHEVNICSSSPFPLPLLSADAGDTVKRRWEEMEIQTHGRDGELEERGLFGLVSHQ